eukprot:1057765-Pelagomonas_calceolata.AAC.1
MGQWRRFKWHLEFWIHAKNQAQGKCDQEFIRTVFHRCLLSHNVCAAAWTTVNNFTDRNVALEMHQYEYICNRSASDESSADTALGQLEAKKKKQHQRQMSPLALTVP